MLEEVYNKKETIRTNDIYRELSSRTDIEQKKLREIFAAFYDIIGENLVESSKSSSIVFDSALIFRKNYEPQKIVIKNGEEIIKPEKVSISIKLGNKIKYRVLDLFHSKSQ